MPKETITYEELDQLIDSFRKPEERPKKKALLVFKAGCEPLRGKEIPKIKAKRLMRVRIDAEELLAKKALDEDDEIFFDFHSEAAKNLGDVIRIVYENNDDEDEDDQKVIVIE